MAKVHVCNVVVQNNPSRFLSKFELEITFECLEELPEDLEWKIIYVGSAESEEFDQVRKKKKEKKATTRLVTKTVNGQSYTI
jgi:hypothetical protein